MFRPNKNWEYQGPEDEYDTFPNYRPIPGAPGTGPPTSEPENNPFEDLPLFSEILYPHAQEIPYHVRWGPNSAVASEYEELLGEYGHWGDDEEEDADEKPTKRTKLTTKTTTTKKKRTRKTEEEDDSANLISEDGSLLDTALGLSSSPTLKKTGGDEDIFDTVASSEVTNDDDDGNGLDTPLREIIPDTNSYDGDDNFDDNEVGFEASDFI